MIQEGRDTSVRHVREAVGPFERPTAWRSIWEVANTLIPFIVLWYLMYLSIDVSYWLTLALALPTAGLYIRVFIILHDCGHGSFFKERKANDWLGVIAGVLTFTPYFQWRYDHGVHHATSGDLDRRGAGDIDTLTVREYGALNQWARFKYRVYRNPLTLLVIGPLAKFVFMERFYTGVGGRRERNSVYGTNLALLILFGGLSLLIGWKAVLLIHLPVLWIGGMIAVWLFYVQHQFEGTTWERHADWDYTEAALHGSSFVKLPTVLNWFTGSIGYHHIHHLSPRIPHYRLVECHDANPMFQLPPISFRDSVAALWLTLWDEEQGKLVGFGASRQI